YDNSAVYSHDNRQYTIMSYFGYYSTKDGAWEQDGTQSGSDGGLGPAGDQDLYSQTPMVDDIAAIQRKYGADTNTRSGNTHYGFNCDIAPINKNGIIIDEGQVYDFGRNEHPIFTIWDAGGTNTLDCASPTYAGSQTIDLREGHYSSIL